MVKLSKRLFFCLSGILVCCLLYYFEREEAEPVVGMKTGIEADGSSFAVAFKSYLSGQKALLSHMEDDLQHLRIRDELAALLEEKANMGEGIGACAIYEKYFRLTQGELARCMNIESADELGKEGFLNSHFGGITIRVSDGICVQYNNIGSISEELLPCGIIIDAAAELGFMGARAGMDFLEIQNNAYETEVKEGFMYSEETYVYYLEFNDDFYRYFFLSYYPDGRASWLLVERE